MVASRSLSTLWLTVENSNVPTAWFLCGEFLLHIPCWLDFYVGSFSYTSRAGFIFIWRVSLTHPVLASFLSGEFLFHIPCWLHFYLESFSSTSRAGFIFIWRVSLTHPVLTLTRWSFSYTSCADFDWVEFLLHFLCWLWLGGVSLTHPALILTRWTFSYTSHTAFIFIWVMSLTHPVLAFFSFFFSFSFFPWGVSLTHPVLISLLEEFLLHIPCWFLYWRSFSYTSRAGFFFFFFSFFFSFFLGSFSYTTHISFNFIWGVSLTHTVLAFILSAGFRLHMPCWLHFYLGSFSYTSRANFVFIWRVSLIHPVLASFYAMSFSYTSRADFFFFHFIRTESLIKDRQPGERRPQQSP